MRKKDLAALVVERLREHYPASCSLVAVKDYELLFATRLSAQCTDARVNVVTAELFSRWPTLEAIAGADLEELMEVVKPCGLYRVKATDIKKCANVLVEQYGGKVPDEMDELLKLPGVGRKTANLVLGDLFGKPAVVTDTHCIRIAGRIGLTDNTEPYKVEMDLKKIIEPKEQNDTCHRFVHFGRDICTARSPKCSLCFLQDVCRYAQGGKQPAKKK